MADTRIQPRSTTSKHVNGDGNVAHICKDLGNICEAKDLYRSKKDASGNSSWTTEIPADTIDAVENSGTEKYALLVRREKCYDGRRQFSIHSIIVQSPALKIILTQVLKDYPGVTVNLRRLEFQPPWNCFVHRWTRLKRIKCELTTLAEARTDNEEAIANRDAMLLFYNILKDEIEDIVTARDDLMREGTMTYGLLWTMFEPGAIIMMEQHAFKLNSTEMTNDGLVVHSTFIDWDGEEFGTDTRYDYITPYAGTQIITQLPVYPISCCKDEFAIRNTIIARAKVFERLCGFRYKQYDGVAEYNAQWGLLRQVKVHSRIVIDTESWNNFNPDDRVRLRALPAPSCARGDDSSSESDLSDNSPDMDTDVDANEPSESTNGVTSYFRDDNTCRLTKDQLLITSTTLRGYSCKDKKWMYFETEHVSEITWNEDAFKDLVLPQKHKEFIRSIAESQALHKNYFDDIISGKGQGMILLLNGPPGVGKTLTAESVAEVMKVPLYYVSAVDLGSSASSVESALSEVFKMVTKWNAVLLLDEADVFLEKRSKQDLMRNELVSVFLRSLEYYNGILFLTSNRSDTIDEAFQSRIHIRLTYESLTAKSRRTIWKNFTRSITYRHNFSEQDFDDLALKDLNGRQIKNLLKTALLLAAREDVPLTKEHVEFVLEIDPQA